MEHCNCWNCFRFVCTLISLVFLGFHWTQRYYRSKWITRQSGKYWTSWPARCLCLLFFKLAMCLWTDFCVLFGFWLLQGFQELRGCQGHQEVMERKALLAVRGRQDLWLCFRPYQYLEPGVCAFILQAAFLPIPPTWIYCHWWGKPGCSILTFKGETVETSRRCWIIWRKSFFYLFESVLIYDCSIVVCWCDTKFKFCLHDLW